MMPMRRPTRGKCALLAQETYYKDNLKSDLLSCFQVDFILKTYRVHRNSSIETTLDVTIGVLKKR
jgi:hypothetical protein